MDKNIKNKNPKPESVVSPPEEHIVRSLDPKVEDMQKNNQKIIYGVYIVLIILGVITGYFLSGRTSQSLVSSGRQDQVINTDTAAGVTDLKDFKDSAEGKLEKGGIDGEGTHSLIREGGPSQTVYLFSSIVDLDEFTGKNVKVWGETFAAEKAGWLMDVGKIEVK